MRTDLESDLRDLRRSITWVEPDGLVGRVRAEIVRPPHGGADRRRIALVAGAMGILLGVGLGPARAALADLFGVDGVKVVVVETLPDDLPAEADLGRPVTLPTAAATVGFPIRLPAVLGRPDGVFVGSPPDGVTLRWDQPAVLVTEHPGALTGVIKTVPVGSRTTPVVVDGVPGLWLTGPHVVTYVAPDGTTVAEPPRRAGNTLVWSEDGVVTRVEVDGPLRGALDLAESLRPAG